METNITINISPASFYRAQNDPDFREEIFRHAETVGNEENIEMDFVPIENDEIENSGVWVDAAVKLLLSQVLELWPKLGTTFTLKTKSKMWKIIELKLREHNYNFTAIQIENKFRGLERNFKKVKSHNNKSGRGRECCAYEKELGEILNSRASVFPNTILGTAHNDVLCREDLLELADEDIEPNTSASETHSVIPSPSSSGPPSAKKSKNDAIANELRLLREERQMQHAEVVGVLKQSSDERNAIMKQSSDERNAILKERNNILKSLMEQLNK